MTLLVRARSQSPKGGKYHKNIQVICNLRRLIICATAQESCCSLSGAPLCSNTRLRYEVSQQRCSKGQGLGNGSSNQRELSRHFPRSASSRTNVPAATKEGRNPARSLNATHENFRNCPLLKSMLGTDWGAKSLQRWQCPFRKPNRSRVFI